MLLLSNSETFEKIRKKASERNINFKIEENGNFQLPLELYNALFFILVIFLRFIIDVTDHKHTKLLTSSYILL